MKKILIFLCVVVALTAGIILVDKGFRRENEHAGMRKVDDVFRFDPDTVTGFSIRTDRASLEIARVAGRWQVVNLFGGIPLEESNIANFLTELKQTRLKSVSNKSSGVQDQWLIDSESVEMVVSGDETVQDRLIFSFKDVEPGKVLMRRQGQPEVFLCDEDILHSFSIGKNRMSGMNVDPWLDKRAADINISDVEALTIRENGKVFADIKQDLNGTMWRFSAGYPYALDVQRVLNYLQLVNSLRGMEFVPAEAVKWGDKDWTLTLRLKDKTIIQIQRTVGPEGSYYLYAAGRLFAVKVSMNHFNSFDHNDGSFFADNPLGIDSSRLTDVRFNYLKEKIKGSFSRKTDSLVWMGAKSVIIDPARIGPVIDALREIRLKVTPLGLKRTVDLLSFGFRQGGVWREVRLRDVLVMPDGTSCFPALLDRDPRAYCLDNPQAVRLVAVVSALSSAKQ